MVARVQRSIRSRAGSSRKGGWEMPPHGLPPAGGSATTPQPRERSEEMGTSNPLPEMARSGTVRVRLDVRRASRRRTEWL